MGKFYHLICFFLSISATLALLPLAVKDKRFILPNSDYKVQGEVFFIKGIDYLPGGSSGFDSSSNSDALSDADICYRDAYVFQQLGINTVRIYSLNPDLDHNECVTIFNNAGIYLLLDVNSGEYGSNLNRGDPQGTYNSQYLGRVFRFIEAFKNFPNVLGFLSGNEVINDQNNYAETTPKYIRAIQRDMKQYIAKHSNRTIPVGYSAADGVELRRATLEYLQCHIDGEGSEDDSTSDFFGLNSYQWCSGSTWTTSGYDDLNSTLSNSSIPLFFSEFGCNTVRPRTFEEISEGLFGGLVNTFSGGLVYEYSEEASQYGVVEIASDGSITYLDEFNNLKGQFENSTTPTILENEVSSGNQPACNAARITGIYAQFGADFDIPEQPSDITSLIQSGVNATQVGKLIDNLQAKESKYSIQDANGNSINSPTVEFKSENEINSQSNVPASSSSASIIKAAPSSSSTASASASTSSSKSKGGAITNSVPSYSVVGLLMTALSYLI